MRSTWFVLLIMGTVLATGAPLAAGPGPGAPSGVEGQYGFGRVGFSPGASYLTVTRWDSAGLAVVELASTRVMLASSSRGAGFHAAWSDGKVLFKEIVPAPTGGPLQRIVAFDPLTEARLVLASGPLMGEPSASLDGATIVWTEGSSLQVFDAPWSKGWEPVTTFALPAYANLAEVDPAGARVAFNDAEGRIGVLQLDSGALQWLTDGGAYAHPSWSPDGAYLSLREPGGGFVVLDATTGATIAEVAGKKPAWASDTTIVYQDVTVQPYEVLASDLVLFDVITHAAVPLTTTDEHEGAPAVSLDGEWLAYSETTTGAVHLTPLAAVASSTLGIPDDLEPLFAGSDAFDLWGTIAPVPLPEGGIEVYVPYMHQKWDTPDEFNGSWSCGPTSCVQIVQKYGRLPDHPITCSWPYEHESLWGWYIPNEYTFNGYTYDELGVSPDDIWVPGAHGFIVLDAGGALGYRMIDFFNQHGLESSWLGTAFSLLTAELDQGYATYLSTSVLGYGHIIVCRGYFPDHTLVVNDPYGDANTGSWGNYDGEEVLYDWQGYNNGHLEIEVGYVFPARGPSWETLEHTVVCPEGPVPSGETATMTVTARNQGSSFWEPNEVRLVVPTEASPSAFFDASTWIDEATPATVDTTVLPGEHATFAITLLMPEVEEETTLSFGVDLVDDQGQTFGPGAEVLSCALTVVPAENVPPVALVKVDEPVTLGDAVTLDGSDSYDPDGAIVAWHWLTPEGFIQGEVVTWTPPDAGVAEVTLTVTDDDGDEGSTTTTITVQAPPVEPTVEVAEPTTEVAEPVVELPGAMEVVDEVLTSDGTSPSDGIEEGAVSDLVPSGEVIPSTADVGYSEQEGGAGTQGSGTTSSDAGGCTPLHSGTPSRGAIVLILVVLVGLSRRSRGLAG